MCSVSRDATFLARSHTIPCPQQHLHSYDTEDFMYDDGTKPNHGSMMSDELDPREVRRLKKIALAIGVTVIVILFLLALAACGSQGPSRGTVVDKRYNPPSSYWVNGIDIPGSCSMVGKIESCSPGIDIPGHIQYVDQSWELKIRSDDGKKTGWRDVDETVFHRCNVNDECDTKQ